MLVYIDESGCLGFDFSKSGTSKYLIFTALVCHEEAVSREIGRAINRTLKNKIKHHKGSRREVKELKGYMLPLKIKHYFYKQIASLSGWELYAIIADKSKWLSNKEILLDKSIFYDWALIALMKEILVGQEEQIIPLILDKSKNATLRARLNARIIAQFKDCQSQFIVFHENSSLEPNLQAVDLFCTGIAKNFEHSEEEWFKVFQSKMGLLKLI